MDEQTTGRKIQSVDTACELIEQLREYQEASLSELADALDLSPGTVHTHLATLKHHGLVHQTDKKYRLGPQLLTLGEFVRNHSDLYRAGKEQIETLAEESGECAHLLIEHDNQLFALYERFGENAVGVEYHDKKREEPLNHLHCTAAGKAILAYRPDEEVEELIASTGLPWNTQNTITDADELFDELKTVRERGFAFADEEQMQGIRAVGAPVRTPNGTAIGAIALSGPTSRLQGDEFREEIPEMINQAANICEVNYHMKDFR